MASKIKKMGEKSQEILRLQNPRTIVLEGAVRSSKTVVSLVKFYQHVLMSNENTFLMAGATMGSVSRNCIINDFGIIAISGGKLKQKVDADGSHYLQVGDTEKRIYYVGAENKASYKKIQGLSIAGFYADEAPNMDRAFFMMALTRSIASENPLDIITLNPEAPGHWFYKEYLENLEKSNNRYYYYHFTLDDNSSLTETRKKEIAGMFTGVFYKKYVLGQRVRAEGACYPSFNSVVNVVDTIPPLLYVQIGVDIGGNKSATSFTATGFYIVSKKIHVIALDELYDTKNKDTETVIENFERFVTNIKSRFNCADIYVDSAEQLLIKSFKNLGVGNIRNSLKKPIIDRIRIVDLLFSQERLTIYKKCTNLIEAIESAVWDDKAKKETRLDDGTVNIDSLDSFEYSIENRLKDLTL
jgi:PBSX family phage terminase large subunit